jgi:hypothetical protein
VNCGPRSYFYYIAITCLLYSHCLFYSHTITIFHSICSFLYLQQTGEIDNLIVSWEQSIWLCCVQVPRCRSYSKARTRHPINCPELSQASKHHLQSYWLLPLLIDIPWFLNWGKTLLLYSSYLPLGVPNWTVKRYQHHTTSICSFLCLQQTGEIDNLIVSWEQSIWLCCVQVPRCSWKSKALDEAPYKLSGAVAKLASITFWSISFFLLDWHTLVSYWGKTCCYIHQTFS